MLIGNNIVIGNRLSPALQHDHKATIYGNLDGLVFSTKRVLGVIKRTPFGL